MAKDQQIDPPLYVKKPEKPASNIAGRIRLYAYMLLILIIIGMYMWKIYDVGRLEKSMDAQRTEMSQKRQQALNEQAKAMLRMMAQPLTWAVRAEIMRDSLSQIDDYFGDLIKERGVQSIFLIDKNSRVAVATNRKLEAQPAADVVSQTIRNAKEVVIEPSESGLRMAVPIMSFNEKIGILVMDYTPVDFQPTNLQQ
jgi:hypothetical protein